MAMIASKDGIRVQFYSADGNDIVDEQEFSHTHVTGQPRSNSSGSDDWISEVYLADSDEELYSLLSASKPTGFFPLGTSLSSRKVTLILSDDDGTPEEEYFASAAGDLDDVIKGGQFPSGFVVVLRTLKVCPTPVEQIKGSEFEVAWQKGVIFFLNQ
jgi:hypothetical protein